MAVVGLGRALQDTVDAISPRFHGAAGAEHGNIAVEPGVLGNTHHLIVQLAQYDAAVFADIGHQIKDALHLRFLHETSRSVGSFVGVGQVAFRVILPNVGIAHAHHHDDQQAQQQQAESHADDPALTEQRFAASGEGQYRRGRGASVAWRSARVLPLLIVPDKLRQIAAAKQQPRQK